jgi:drug/metabolite transporter (DMT)-like permease
MPIVALIWGGYDGESLKIGHFLGMILILLGVYVVGRESMHKHRTKKADH